MEFTVVVIQLHAKCMGTIRLQSRDPFDYPLIDPNFLCHPDDVKSHIAGKVYMIYLYIKGADPGFQVRGGALKKIAPSGGRRENFWGISCEKSRFYAKKSYFFRLRREARKFLRYFV